jgi:hypothetical protein
MDTEYYMYERQARKGTLPADFSQWGLVDHNGRTIAHVAAFLGCLPNGFDQWELATVTASQ